MSTPLLTIVVPTYNRAECLSLLLETLQGELAGLEDRVRVIVGDNASTDATPAVASRFAQQYPPSQLLRHANNLGPEENFCRCVEAVTTRFFWMMGDDDLPKAGSVAGVLEILERLDPDLLSLGSEWLPQLAGPDAGTPLRELCAHHASSTEFAAAVNVWITFISGIVVNKERLYELQPRTDLRRFANTQLVQLGWVLPLLRSGNRLFVAPERCVLATSANTGGYRVVRVFATNLPRVIEDVFDRSSRTHRAIMRRVAWSYVPGLLWMIRSGGADRFKEEDVEESLRPLRGMLAYPLVLWPVLTLPRPLAYLVWIASRALGKALRLHAMRRIEGGAPALRVPIGAADRLA